MGWNPGNMEAKDIASVPKRENHKMKKPVIAPKAGPLNLSYKDVKETNYVFKSAVNPTKLRFSLSLLFAQCPPPYQTEWMSDTTKEPSCFSGWATQVDQTLKRP